MLLKNYKIWDVNGDNIAISKLVKTKTNLIRIKLDKAISNASCSKCVSHDNFH